MGYCISLLISIQMENIKHLSVRSDITFIQARQPISDEPKASQILARMQEKNLAVERFR